MVKTVNVEVVSAEAQIFSGKATFIAAPGEMGELGITPRHTQLLSRLKPGEVRVTNEEGTDEFFFVSGGVMEVQPDLVTILADTALRAVDADEAAAAAAKKAAEEAMQQRKSDFDYARAEAELIEAAERLKWVRSLKQRGLHERR